MTIVEKYRTKIIVTGLIMGLLLSSLDQTITATAMPTIISNLGGLSLYSWVFSIYMLTATASIPIFGKMADLYGRKRIYLVGMGLFILGSALCGMAASMMQLIIFRGIQGIGAGALMPLAMTIIGDLFPPEKRGKMQGIIGAVFGISSIAGPAIGGFITEQLDWHWVFFVNLPFGILAAAILATSLKDVKSKHKPSIDWLGALTLTLAIISILLVTVLGGDGKTPGTYPWSSLPIIGLISLSVILLGLFIYIETQSKEPIMPLSLFKHRTIAVSAAVGFFSGIGMFGAITYIPLFAQGVIGVSPSQAGYILTPMMLAMVVSSTIGGFYVTKLPFRSVMIFSMSLLSVGMLLMSRMSTSTDSLTISFYMVILGTGMGPLMPLLTVSVQNAVGFSARGVATSSIQFFRSIGGALGVSILGAAMANKMAAGLNTLAGSLEAIPLEQIQQFSNAQSLLRPEVRSLMPHQILEGVTQVLAQSISSVFIIGLVFILIGSTAIFFIGDSRVLPPRTSDRT